MSVREARRRRQEGAAAVEFALVAPLLLLLLFGIISYGYMLSFRQALSQGAAEGARAAAVTLDVAGGSKKVEAARQALNEALGSYGVTCDGPALKRAGTQVGTCEVTEAACSNNHHRQCATVTVDYLYRQHSLLPSLPGIGAVLPEHLKYSAVAEVS
ncbi:TadE/TadG family type IV pilus assembly protein [Nocardioides ferulae]|uniref:TadE/TadG family type IV pilus assembly protein n=1 Tax=Nocardioides ferulae TaxID=2340821 RepID=UPI000EADFC29|nr:TadE/TadG family type IV pilus assembly protein [Nocardioides ferulae]